MTVIDDYLKKVTPQQKDALERVRTIVRQIVPDAEEVISYGMPVLKHKGKYVIGFAAFKDHMSVFPGPEAIEAVKDKLAGYKLSKGTIQFTSENPIPESIMKEMILNRLNNISQKN